MTHPLAHSRLRGTAQPQPTRAPRLPAPRPAPIIQPLPDPLTLATQALASALGGQLTGTLLLSAKETARLLRCSVRNVRTLIQTGRLASIRLSRRGTRIYAISLAHYLATRDARTRRHRAVDVGADFGASPTGSTPHTRP